MTGRFVFYVALLAGGAILLAGGAMFSGILDVFAEAADKKYIVDDSTGGSCSQIGIWDDLTRTCTLTSDLTDVQIYIESNEITLDGNGRTFTLTKEFSTSGDDAVTIDRKTGVTIKNFIFRNYHYGVNLHYADSNTVSNIVAINTGAGISLSGANSNTLTNNNISNNSIATGICIGYASSNNYIAGNTVTNIERGIYLHDLSDGNTITGNTLTNNVAAIALYDSDSYNVITDNIISTNVTLPDPIQPPIGAAVYLHRSSQNNIVAGNTISGMNNGLYFSDGASMNKVYHNNFMGNGDFQIEASGGINNEFSQPSAGGGNYWKVYDTPDEGCSDINIDGFCDAPFVFLGGQDNLPLTNQNG